MNKQIRKLRTQNFELECNVVTLVPATKTAPPPPAPYARKRSKRKPKRHLAEQLARAFIEHCIAGGAAGCRLEFQALLEWWQDWLVYEGVRANISPILFAQALTAIGIPRDVEYSKNAQRKSIKKSYRTIPEMPLALAA